MPSYVNKTFLIFFFVVISIFLRSFFDDFVIREVFLCMVSSMFWLFYVLSIYVVAKKRSRQSVAFDESLCTELGDT